MAVPNGDDDSSSSRLHCTRIGASRPPHGDESGVEGGVVGAVMAVAAGALPVHDGDCGLVEPERQRERSVQQIDALRMRPHGQAPVREQRESAGGPDGAVRQEGLGIARDDRPGRLVGRALAGIDDAVGRRQALERARLVQACIRRLAALPNGGLASARGGGGKGGLVGSDEHQKIALAEDIDLPAGSAPGGGLVETGEPGVAPGPVQGARVQQPLRRKVMDERRAEHLGGQVEARRAAADEAISVGMLGHDRVAHLAGEIDAPGERPIIEAGLLAVPQDASVRDRQLAGLAGEPGRRRVEEAGAHVGADEADRAARHLDR